MKVIFQSKKVEKICSDMKSTTRFFGGDRNLAISLHARINALRNAETMKDIIIQKVFHFHNLHNKNGKDLEGFYAIDIKTRRDPWGLILKPLKDDESDFGPHNIDEIASKVIVVGIEEVSKHYE